MSSKTCNSSPEDATLKLPECRSGQSVDQLTEDERRTLARIRRNRDRGWMATFEEFDFLLDATERLSRRQQQRENC